MNTEPRIVVRGAGIGLANGVLLSAIMVPTFLAGISPMPQPPSLAFAEALLGEGLPMPAGLAFHLVYVIFWSTVWVAREYPRLRFSTALLLGLMLWVVALVVFFPINGWGFLGLAVGPKLIPAALVPHLLFSVFLWGLGRIFLAGHR